MALIGDVRQLAGATFVASPVDLLASPSMAAHRGGRDLYPEGSMVAFRAVAQNNPGMVLEMDVRPLADGTLVVCHDATIDRIASGGTAGLVSSMTQAEWSALAVKNTSGSSIGPAAFLSDVLDEFGGTKAVLMVELKDYTPAARNRYIEQLWPYRDQVVSACFNAPVARTLAMSGFTGQYLVSNPPASVPGWAKQVACGHTNITPETVAMVHAAGAKLWAWTVNDTARKNELLAMGVDGVMTDNPNI